MKALKQPQVQHIQPTSINNRDKYWSLAGDDSHPHPNRLRKNYRYNNYLIECVSVATFR